MRGSSFLRFFCIIFVLLFTFGCVIFDHPTEEFPSVTPPSSTLSPETEIPLPVHQIGIRVVNGVGEFYNKLTGEKFIPRGNNFIRLANQMAPGGEIFFHSMFNTGLYNPIEVDQVLNRMHTEGYNTVRIMLNGCCSTNSLGNPTGGISTEYVANLTDFLEKAKLYQIFVVLEPGDLPPSGGYIEILDTSWSVDFEGTNSPLLRTGGVNAHIKRWQDLINELIRQDAPLDIILAYELSNEVFFDSAYPPFSKTSGIVSTANGKSYNMADEDDKQKMMEEGLIYWIDTIRSEILELDPTALVTVGFFVPQIPHPTRIGDERWIDSRAAIWESKADFIDLHPYPGTELSLQEYVDNFEMLGMQEKPIIMGEFGAARSSFLTEEQTAQVIHDWQVESCKYGFDGWLLWTYDTEEQSDFYNGLTGQGLINQVLAPINRSDPCKPGDFKFFENNLAFEKSVVASQSLENEPPSQATDGTANLAWGAGDFPPQWVQIDLGEPKTIAKIRLLVNQSPEGNTIHEVWVGRTRDSMVLVHTFSGYTVSGQILEYTIDPSLDNIQFIKIVTKASPSWVAWKEIEVLAP